MINAGPGNNFVAQLLKALGLAEQQVTKIVLTVAMNEMITVEITRYPSEDEMTNLAGILTRYRLEEMECLSR